MHGFFSTCMRGVYFVYKNVFFLCICNPCRPAAFEGLWAWPTCICGTGLSLCCRPVQLDKTHQEHKASARITSQVKSSTFFIPFKGKHGCMNNKQTIQIYLIDSLRVRNNIQERFIPQTLLNRIYITYKMEMRCQINSISCINMIDIYGFNWHKYDYHHFHPIPTHHYHPTHICTAPLSLSLSLSPVHTNSGTDQISLKLVKDPEHHYSTQASQEQGTRPLKEGPGYTERNFHDLILEATHKGAN